MAKFLANVVGLVIIVLTFYGIFGLINPRWTGFKSRGRSCLIYFGSAFICWFFVVGLIYPTIEEKDGVSNSDKEEASQAPVKSDRSQSIKYTSLRDLVSDFSSLTEAQRNKWREDNDWNYWVEGTCVVSEVSNTNWMSEISQSEFEVSCELSDGNRAVLFYGESNKEDVLDLDKGDVIDFRGQLKTIRHWAFWTSGYVKVKYSSKS